MSVSELLAYLGALFIGVVLGLIGGGGSILTLPVLVYILNLNPVTATAYSLFVVGTTSLVGAYKYFQKKLFDFKTAFIFAIPSLITVYLTRRFLIPAIPEHLFTVGTFNVSRDIGIMLFFAIIMLLASLSMINTKRKEITYNLEIKYNYPFIFLEGVLVGLLTGIVGAGGGFLIIPALVLLAKLPMKKAVGTSLIIIAAKSLIGFIGDVQTLEIDWIFLLKFTSISIVGILLGTYLSRHISGDKLKKGFGWFILIMGVFIIYMELLWN